MEQREFNQNEKLVEQVKQEILEDTSLLLELEIAGKIIEQTDKYRGKYDPPLDKESIFFHIVNRPEDVRKASPTWTNTNILVFHYAEENKSYVSMAVGLRKDRRLGGPENIRLTPEEFNLISSIANSRMMQNTTRLEIELLNNTMNR